MAGLLRQQHRYRLEVDNRLAAKAAADLRRVALEVAQLHADQLGGQAADDEVALARAPDFALAVGVVFREAGMRLDIALMHGRRLELLLDDHVGFLEAGFDVADREVELLGDVRRLLRRRLHAARLHVLEQQRRVRLHRVVDVDDMRQDFVFDLDQRAGLGRRRRIDRGHRGDRVAFIEHLLARHDVAGHVPEVDRDALGADVGEILIGEILRRDDRLHARQLLGLRGVDRLDARMRMGAAQDLAVERAGQRVVVAVFGRAGHFRHAVRSNGSRANPLKRFLDLVHLKPLRWKQPRSGNRQRRQEDRTGKSTVPVQAVA